MNRVRIHPAAEEELLATADWYLERASIKIAERFNTAIEQALLAIREEPESFVVLDHWRGVVVRRVLVTGFPYQLVYGRANSGDLWVFAGAHLHREPGYWRTRLAEAR